ncbi:Na/Pi cotransporter family protein [Bradyrhizobium sp.]|jgi:phosphate:Na+ symporter|uniref:Na/Pi cotransporter family protein n=3 Tax=Bradyrhizobium sp. TaxID=376 RepID=UPI00391A97CF
MTATIVLFELAGYVGLLLWGTHMVTTGVQRGFGTALRVWLEHNLSRRWQAFLAGVGITALLQSSTATGLMSTAFTVNGLIGLGPALVVMLGANVGTTLVTQVLSYDAAMVAPPLVLAGVVAFRSFKGDRARNTGRIAIGLGLMLLALSGMVHELAPIESVPLLKGLLGALVSEPLLAVAVATILTWGSHSSVAIVLLIMSLAATHTVSPSGALALVLGANIGGTLPPLFEAGSPIARRLPLGNLLVRLVGAVAVLPFLSMCVPLLAHLDQAPSRIVVNFHTAFNLILAAVFIGPSGRLAQLLIRLLPEPPAPNDPGKPLYLEAAALGAPAVALANAARETLRMGDMVEAMLRGAAEIFQQDDRQRATEISRLDRSVDRLGAAIRSYLADLGDVQTLDDESEGARVQEILSAVINLEHVGDVVANSLLEFAAKRIKRGHPFANDELDLIASMNAEILESLRIGLAVFLARAPTEAKRLVSRKARLRHLEARATALHVRLLREAATMSRTDDGEGVARVAEEGGQFLRIVRDLRRVHSHIAALAYPTLNDLYPEESPAEMDETGEEPIREIAKRQPLLASAVAVRDRSAAIP